MSWLNPSPKTVNQTSRLSWRKKLGWTLDDHVILCFDSIWFDPLLEAVQNFPHIRVVCAGEVFSSWAYPKKVQRLSLGSRFAFLPQKILPPMEEGLLDLANSVCLSSQDLHPLPQKAVISLEKGLRVFGEKHPRWWNNWSDLLIEPVEPKRLVSFLNEKSYSISQEWFAELHKKMASWSSYQEWFHWSQVDPRKTLWALSLGGHQSIQEGDVWTLRGWAFWKMRQPDTASWMFSKALSFQKNHPDAYKGLGLVARWYKAWPEALIFFKKEEKARLNFQSHTI